MKVLEFCFRTKTGKDATCERISVSAALPDYTPPSQIACSICAKPIIQGSKHVLDMLKGGAHFSMSSKGFSSVPVERRTCGGCGVPSGSDHLPSCLGSFD